MATKKKDVSALVSALGVLMTIVTGLVTAVRKLGGTDEQIYKLATPEGAELLEKIAQLIVSPVVQTQKAVEGLFHLIIDHSQTLQQMIAAGKYDYINGDITAERFPVTGEGTVELDAELIHIGRYVTNAEAEAELDRRGYRPATMAEQLAFGATFPEEQRKYPIVALAAFWRYPYGNRSVASLDSDGLQRELDLHWMSSNFQWYDACRFLAVRKA